MPGVCSLTGAPGFGGPHTSPGAHFFCTATSSPHSPPSGEPADEGALDVDALGAGALVVGSGDEGGAAASFEPPHAAANDIASIPSARIFMPRA